MIGVGGVEETFVSTEKVDGLQTVVEKAEVKQDKSLRVLDKEQSKVGAESFVTKDTRLTHENKHLGCS